MLTLVWHRRYCSTAVSYRISVSKRGNQRRRCYTRRRHPHLCVEGTAISLAIHYFPVSQDINSDPEVWELTDKFGDRALRVWLEILSIADRNNGTLPGHWEHYPSILAGRCKSTTRHLRAVCEWVARWLVIDSQGVASVRNYSKYHKIRADRSTAPNPPNQPILTNRPIKIAQPRKTTTLFPEDFTVTDHLKAWCLTQGVADPQPHLEAFRDYHVSKGSRFIDWSAAFHTWIRNSRRFGQNGNAQKEGELSERTQRILRRGL